MLSNVHSLEGTGYLLKIIKALWCTTLVQEIKVLSLNTKQMPRHWTGALFIFSSAYLMLDVINNIFKNLVSIACSAEFIFQICNLCF